MRPMKTPLILFLYAVLLVSYFSPAHASDNNLLGTGLGAALGGFAGSHIGKGDGQLAATGAGVFLGGMIGNSVSHSMRQTPRIPSHTAYPSYNTAYETYPSYAPNYVAPYDYPMGTRADAHDYVYVRPGAVEYYSPRQTVLVEGGYVGVAPLTYRQHHPQRHRNRHCREFTQTVRIDGQAHESYGTACLRPDGSWQIEP